MILNISRLKLAISALAVLMLFFLAACGGDNASTATSARPPDAASSAGSSVEASLPPDSGGTPSVEGGASASSADDSASAVLQSVQGAIEDMGMGKYYVRLQDDRLIAFDTAGADTNKLTETRPGSPIAVYYTGTLQGTDTVGITVVRMETP